MGTLGAILAIVLPWIASTALLALVWHACVPGRWPFVLGYGFVVGQVMAAVLLRAQGTLAATLDPTMLMGVWALTAVAAVAALGRALWRASHTQAGSVQVGGATPLGMKKIRSPTPTWARALCGLLLAWLALRWAGWAVEVTQQALYPWDAFTTWAYRARAWVHASSLVPIVSPEAWWGDTTGRALTVAAAHYPMLPSLVSAWPALAYGGWNEQVANLPWLGLAGAMCLALYGQARLWGASALAAMMATWMLASFPIVGSHVAIAGYFDLWMAACLGMAFMAFMHWARGRARRDAVLALAMALACLMLKNEGTVWVLFFLPALLAMWVRWRGWVMALGLVRVLLGLLAATGGFGFDLPGAGRVALSLTRVELPRIGVIEFGLEPGVLSAVLVHLFVFDSWHLAMPALLVTLAVFAADAVRSGGLGPHPAWMRAGLAWVLAALGGFVFLFAFTGASEWALRGTSVNRILMQFAPAFVFWGLTVWLRALGGEAAAGQSAAPANEHAPQRA